MNQLAYTQEYFIKRRKKKQRETTAITDGILKMVNVGNVTLRILGSQLLINI